MKAFSLVITVIIFTLALPVHAADFGSCTPDPGGRHLYFSVAQGKLLLQAIQDLRHERGRVRILEQRLTLKDEQASLWRMQMESAEKALTSTTQALAVKTKRVQALELDVAKWQQEAARLKAERIWWAIGGAGVAILVIGAGVLVGWAVGR